MTTGQPETQTPASPAPPWWATLALRLSPIEERPRVVDGIESVMQTTRAGVPSVVIRNPAANTYLKLNPNDYELLPLMNGERTVKALVIEYYRRHGVLALPRVINLVHLLRSQSFLTEPPTDAWAVLRQRLGQRNAGMRLVRLFQMVLQTEFPLPKTDPALGALYRRGGWLLFTRPGALAGLLIVLLGGAAGWLELQAGRYNLFQTGGSSFAAFFILLLAQWSGTTIHELGHGLAVKYARRRVDRAGFLIYYGRPTAFVDTTDLWMATREQRLLASFAGPWAMAMLTGVLLTAAWLLPTGAVGAFLYGIGTWWFILNFLNFNPFLEFDGYYMLVDYAEKPMLRARAFAFIQGPLWTKLGQRQPLTREERFFALFGIASAVWSVVFLLLNLAFWETQLAPIVRSTWNDGGAWGQAGVALVALLIGIPLVQGVWSLLRHALGWGKIRLAWLERWSQERRLGLRAVPLWAELPEGRLLEIARVMQHERIPAGMEVVRQGEPGERFFVIASGAFEVVVSGAPVVRLQRGSYFGERALLDDAPRAATVVALEDSTVYAMGRAQFAAGIAHDLAVQQKLTQALAYRSEVEALPLFRGLEPTELDLLLGRLTPVAVAAGEEIIRQGEPGDRFYVLRRGEAEVRRDGVTLERLGPGQAFGEIALLYDVPRTATVQAVTACDLLALNAADFHDLLAGYCGRARDLEQLSHLRLQSHQRPD